MPMPVSDTRRRAESSTWSTVTVILPPLGVNLMAFTSRFHATCCRRDAVALDGPHRVVHLHLDLDRLPLGLRSDELERCPHHVRRGPPAGGRGSSFPAMIRETSRRSSMSCTCVRVLRSMTAAARAVFSGVAGASPEQLRLGQQRGERRPELVGEGREELVLGRVRALRVVPGRLRLRELRRAVRLAARSLRHVLEGDEDASARRRAPRSAAPRPRRSCARRREARARPRARSRRRVPRQHLLERRAELEAGPTRPRPSRRSARPVASPGLERLPERLVHRDRAEVSAEHDERHLHRLDDARGEVARPLGGADRALQLVDVEERHDRRRPSCPRPSCRAGPRAAASGRRGRGPPGRRAFPVAITLGDERVEVGAGEVRPDLADGAADVRRPGR